MPPGINGYSVGRDITLNINTPSGLLRLSTITNFKASPNTEKHQIRGLDGIRRPLVFPDGWNGSFEVARRDATLDQFWAQIESNYYAGSGIPGATITETINNPDGTVSQFRYTGVVLILEDAGDWRGNEAVMQRLSFEAEQRIQVS